MQPGSVASAADETFKKSRRLRSAICSPSKQNARRPSKTAHGVSSGPMSISDQSPFSAIATELQEIVEAALVKLLAIGEENAARPLAPGKWSPKEVVGH